MPQRLARRIFAFVLLLAWCMGSAFGQDKSEYSLAAGDMVRVQVFQNPDLTIEARVSESGTISFPLLGQIQLGGLTVGKAEQLIAEALVKGGFIRNPQVNINLVQIRGSQVSVLGQVNRPGRFPLEALNVYVKDMLAIAGGVIPGSGTFPGGSDVLIVTGVRDGKPFRREVDIAAMFLDGRPDADMLLMGGDSIYVPRAPVFYIYGEAQRSGVYRIERGMTVMQALAAGGGPTARGTEKRVRLHRRNAAGQVEQSSPGMDDTVLPNDVLYVRESLF